MKKYTPAEVISHLRNLQDWKFLDDGIEKTFRFQNFSEAFSFIGRVALLSEKMQHHPDWSGLENLVHIRLSTHEVCGISPNDIEMATEIETFISH